MSLTISFSYCFFSEKSIEDRLIAVSTDYSLCTYLLIPLGFGLFYALVYPYFILGVNSIRTHSKGMQKARALKEKIDSLDGKIKLEKKTRDLDSVRAGIKEISELKTQIKELEIATLSFEEQIFDKDTQISKIAKEKKELNQTLTDENKSLIKEQERIKSLLKKSLDLPNNYNDENYVKLFELIKG